MDDIRSVEVGDDDGLYWAPVLALVLAITVMVGIVMTAFTTDGAPGTSNSTEVNDPEPYDFDMQGIWRRGG